jgi:hypothetical protein
MDAVVLAVGAAACTSDGCLVWFTAEGDGGTVGNDGDAVAGRWGSCKYTALRVCRAFMLALL